jgi:hypothetical protein
MPVLTPILERSVVRLAHDAGKRLWIPAPKNPYKTQKTYKEPTSCTAAQQ